MAKRDENEGVRLHLIKPVFMQLLKAHPEFKRFSERWEYKRNPEDTVGIGVRKFSVPALETLYSIFQANGSKMGDRWSMGQIAAHIKALKSGGGTKVEQLRALESAIISFIKKDIINCWVFHKNENNGVLQAKFVTNAYYVPAEVRKEYKRAAYVSMQMKWWSRGEEQTTSFHWNAVDAIGKTVEELLAEENCFHETPELVKLYEENEKKFMLWRTQMGEQFVGQGNFESHEESSSHHRRHRASDSEMAGTRLVIDDECKAIENEAQTSLFISYDPTEDADDFSMDDEEEQADKPLARKGEEDLVERFTRLPLAHHLWCFNLSSYNNGWVHIDSIKPYVYRPELREKLVLSEEHSDLIDTLTADMDILMEDIISGKSGGTAILCQGVAGTGKTLTAEVYAEVIKRPLYRVHSGQLGTDSGSVEVALKKALENAMRWRAVLLIDEADVFISTRGDDLEKNAVIGVFLRVLEYYSGLLFMTTNRVDTIDEAILSRCIAQIKFDLPNEEERVRLWQTLGDVYGMDLVKTKSMAEKLAKEFKCSGRDIKGLIKLVTKFSRQRKKQPTLEDFKRLAAFKGL